MGWNSTTNCRPYVPREKKKLGQGLGEKPDVSTLLETKVKVK